MKLTRRKFLIGSGLVGGGLIIGLQFKPAQPILNTLEGSFQPNAWLQITEEGHVIFQLDKAEMGQGVMTSMAMTIGEELDFDPANIMVELAGIYPAYANAEMGVQLTGASTSTKTTWLPLREAGATARALLIQAAAAQWGVDPASCSTDDGRVLHPSSQRSSLYGELVKTARLLRDAGKVSLKPEAQFRWIGTALARKDAPAKVDGTAVFGLDIDLRGMKTAVIRRCPQAGGSPKNYDAASIEKMPGVIKVFTMHSGIAVVADTYWQARKAADTLQVEWHKGPLAGLDNAAIHRQYEEALASKKPRYAIDEGDIEAAAAASAITLDASYSTPFFHHSPMEPMNTTAVVRGDSCEVWCPSQAPDMARALIAHFTGLQREKITVHSTLMGGAFGRRGYVDFAGEAGAIAAQLPGVPVKLVWSREDDMQHDFFRGYTCHAIKAALDDQGHILSWQHTLVSTSIVQSIMPTLMPTMMPELVSTDTARSMARAIGNGAADYDPGLFEGALIPYAIPNRKTGAVFHDPGIPTGFWRSVGHFHNAFTVECFFDECAHAAGKDPAQLRRAYLQDHPRHLRVLDEVLQMSGWGKTARHQGLAVHESFGSFVAMVAEVSVSGTDYRVDKVWCAVDCGLPVNPGIIIQQMESGIAYGLTAAIKPPVTFRDGAVEQSNFHDLPVLRMDEMPEVSVSVIDSKASPGGVGEIAVPPITPALGNALFAATGQRLRQLPFRLA